LGFEGGGAGDGGVGCDVEYRRLAGIETLQMDVFIFGCWGKCQSQSEFSGKCTHGPAEPELSAISAILGELALHVGLYILYSPYSLRLLGSTNSSHDQRGTRLQ
jgi:hypothetical protein